MCRFLLYDSHLLRNHTDENFDGRANQSTGDGGGVGGWDGGGGHTHQPVRWFYWINFSSFTITNYDTQTAVVWSCLPFIRSCQNHLARHNERGKKTRQTGEEVGRQHQGMDRPGVCQVAEGSGEQGKMEEAGCEIICGAPTTLAVKG